MTNSHEEVYKKLQTQYTDEEIAEGYMIPASMTPEERAASDAEMRKLRFERLQNRTEEERLLSEVMRLRIKISKYLKLDLYMPAYSFGSMLKEYLKILDKTYRVFADEIGIHYTRLSRIINGREDPNSSIMYRLEQHSGELIPALFWRKLLNRKLEYDIQQESEAKASAKAEVKGALVWKK